MVNNRSEGEPINSELAVVLEAQDLSEGRRDELAKAFGGPFDEAGAILREFTKDKETGALIPSEKAVRVTDATQIKEMNAARKQRLILKNARTTIEKKRVELKAESLKAGRAIDAVATYVKSKIEPIEKYLELQEKFVENERKREQAEKLTKRTEEIAKFADPAMFSLATMPDDQFDKLLDDLKQQEIERLAAEKEQARLREEAEKAEQKKKEDLEKENKRLREQAEAQRVADERKTKRVNQVSKMGMAWNDETSAYESYDQFIASQDILDLDTDKWQQLVDAVESKLKVHREAEAEEQRKKEAADAAERKRLKDLQDKEDARIAAEKRAKDEKDEAERQALLAPDKEKLVAYANEITSLTPPNVKSREAGKLVDATVNTLAAISEKLNKYIAEL